MRLVCASICAPCACFSSSDNKSMTSELGIRLRRMPLCTFYPIIISFHTMAASNILLFFFLNLKRLKKISKSFPPNSSIFKIKALVFTNLSFLHYELFAGTFAFCSSKQISQCQTKKLLVGWPFIWNREPRRFLLKRNLKKKKKPWTD